MYIFRGHGCLWLQYLHDLQFLRFPPLLIGIAQFLLLAWNLYCLYCMLCMAHIHCKQGDVIRYHVPYIIRVGQNRMYTPYKTVISLLIIPYVHRIYKYMYGSGQPWSHIHGHTWSHMVIYGHTRSHMATHGHTWSHMVIHVCLRSRSTSNIDGSAARMQQSGKVSDECCLHCTSAPCLRAYVQVCVCCVCVVCPNVCIYVCVCVLVVKLEADRRTLGAGAMALV